MWVQLGTICPISCLGLLGGRQDSTFGVLPRGKTELLLPSGDEGKPFRPLHSSSALCSRRRPEGFHYTAVLPSVLEEGQRACLIYLIPAILGRHCVGSWMCFGLDFLLPCILQALFHGGSHLTQFYLALFFFGRFFWFDLVHRTHNCCSALLLSYTFFFNFS